MKVCISETEDGYIADGHLAWAPGTYPTPRAAARAAWNMRDHGTPEDRPKDDYTVERQDDGRIVYRLTEASRDRLDEP